MEIAIIGVGPWGLAVFERILAHAAAKPAMRIVLHLIDKERPGPGIHKPDLPEYLLLNTVSGQICLFGTRALDQGGSAADQPTFAEWCAARGSGSSEHGFRPRRELGAYLAWVFDTLKSRAPTNVVLQEWRAEAVDGVDRLLDALDAATRRPGEWNAVYSVAFLAKEALKGIVFRARYTAEPRRNRLLIHRPRNILNIPVQLLARFSAINNFVWNRIHRAVEERGPYIDDLEGYHFFMDGHRRAKEFAERFGFRAPTIQQTFVVPGESLQSFLSWMERTLRERKLTPNLFDALFVPADEFLLSSSNGLAGYAVSIAFDDLNKRRIAEIRQMLSLASDHCQELRGRVHFVKNVHASPEVIARMYGPALGEFVALKQRLDPAGILRNAFFDRVLGAA